MEELAPVPAPEPPAPPAGSSVAHRAALAFGLALGVLGCAVPAMMALYLCSMVLGTMTWAELLQQGGGLQPDVFGGGLWTSAIANGGALLWCGVRAARGRRVDALGDAPRATRTADQRHIFVSMATILSSNSSALAASWALMAPRIEQLSKMALHSIAEPRAVAKKRARSSSPGLPTASAMLSGIESAARRSWSPSGA
jgi:hypothetical protein